MKKHIIFGILLITFLSPCSIYASSSDSDDRGNILVGAAVGSAGLFSWIFKKEKNKTKGTIPPNPKEYINMDTSEAEVISETFTHTT